MPSPVPEHLRRVDNFRSALAILFDWSVILGAAAVSLSVDSLGVYFVSVFVIAGRMQAMWCLGHEATHRGLFSSRTWNDRLSDWVLLFPLLYARTAEFRRWHMKHHSRFWQLDDPVAQYIRSLGPPGSKRQRVWQLLVLPLLGRSGWEWLVDHAQNPSKWLPGLWLWLPILALSYFLGALNVIILYWIVPLVWLFPVFESWSGICDHYNTRSGTRSTLGLFARMFMHGHNNGYHQTHHTYPAVVWHRLPDAERYFAQPQRDVANGLVPLIHQLFVERLAVSYGMQSSELPEQRESAHVSVARE